ncbi:MAG: hypothetical protein EHM13_02905, partial [Acidobacteria bacterium]
MDTLLQDMRHAVRMALRSPGITALAAAALAIGIGANTAIFTIVHAVMLEPLPIRDPARVVLIWERNPESGKPNTISPANFLRWQQRATSFEQMAAFFDWTANLTGAGRPEELVVQNVNTNFFPTLGASPLRGRTFSPDEGPDGRNRVAVMSHALWLRRFGGDESAVGRSIHLNGLAFTVIGVMPADFRSFIKEGSLQSKPADLWVPFAFS